MPGGRPPKFKTAEEFESMADQWFEACQETKQTPTITGLCYFLGFESRQSFYDYEERSEFSYLIKRYRLRVESGYEQALMSRNVVGAIFALKNMGWRDKHEVENTGTQKVEVVWDKSLLPPTNTD